MLDGLFIFSIAGTVVEAIKEKFIKEVPLENWANDRLYRQDVINGVPIEQRIKNLHNGKYKITNEVEKEYPKPHRNADGKIIIENCKLHDEDMRKYGLLQVIEWENQGKYNLSPEELKEERERIKKESRRKYGY